MCGCHVMQGPETFQLACMWACWEGGLFYFLIFCAFAILVFLFGVCGCQGMLRGDFGDGDTVVISAPGGEGATGLVLVRSAETDSAVTEALPELDEAIKNA
jgi:hypothetical protein